jgi:hypothetical protein
MGLDMKTKQALTIETAKRYRKATRKDKTSILDDFVGNTGYHRKYALHILANWDKTRLVPLSGEVIPLKTGNPKKRKKRTGKTIYGPDVVRSLKTIWEFFWHPCGKLLAPLLRAQMPFFESWARLLH